MVLSDSRTQLLQKALPEHRHYWYMAGPHTRPKRRCLRNKGNISEPEHSCSKSSREPSAEDAPSCREDTTNPFPVETKPPVLVSLQRFTRATMQKKHTEKEKKHTGPNIGWCEYKQNSSDSAKGHSLTPVMGLPLSPQVKRGFAPSPCHVLLPGLQLRGLFGSCSFQQDPAAQRDILPIASTIWAQLETQIDH